jgi:CRISPR-associated protein Cas1
LVSDPVKRKEVVIRMYRFRFGEELDPDLSIEQIRGLEGVRVRSAYAEASRHTGVPWNGRFYVRGHWNASDGVNRALSSANACLNGLCHAAIVSAGYSTGLGFVHTGKLLSFVYDIADLYKVETTIPLAFKLTAESREKLESRARHACRDLFYQQRLMSRILTDMDTVLGFRQQAEDEEVDNDSPDSDPALPGELWSPDGNDPGGTLYLPDDESDSDVEA